MPAKAAVEWCSPNSLMALRLCLPGRSLKFPAAISHRRNLNDTTSLLWDEIIGLDLARSCRWNQMLDARENTINAIARQTSRMSRAFST